VAETVGKFFLTQGVLGVLCLVLGWVLWKREQSRETNFEKQRVACETEKAALLAVIEKLRTDCETEKKELVQQLGQEKTARVVDAQGYAGLSLSLQKDVLSYVQGAKTQDEKIVERLTDQTVALAKNTTATEGLSARFAEFSSRLLDSLKR
jgi:hypothetical protein